MNNLSNQSNQSIQKKDTGANWSRVLPYATIAALVVVSYLVLFHSGFGLMKSAQAQVNYGRIGESITETVTEAASEHAGEVAEAEQETGASGGTEEAAPEGGGEGAVPIPTGELPPGETAETAGEGAAAAPVIVTTSDEGIGGTRITDLSPEQLRDYLLQVLAQEEIPAFMADELMPTLLRFQIMVSPEEQQVDPDNPPWLSGSRRYSPFDPIGIGGESRAPLAQPIPPFRNPEPEGGGGIRTPEITAAQIASGLTVIGVMGEPGNFQAIIAGAGQQKVVRVGDEVATIGETTFIVDDITLLAVRIANRDQPGDTGNIYFVNREQSGVAEISISY